MDGRRSRLIDPVLGHVPTIQRTSGPLPPARARLAPGWARLLGLGWPLAFLVMMALEPVPADPEAVSPPLLVEVASLAFLVALGCTVVAAAMRHPAAALTAVAAGLIAAVFSITCPVSGHHDLGLWWFAQFGVVLAMLAASCAALGSRARTGA